MRHLHPQQRCILASVLFPLLDLMQAKVEVSHQVPLTAKLVAVAATAHTNIQPHPEQGGQQITEAYLQEMTEAECIWRFR